MILAARNRAAAAILASAIAVPVQAADNPNPPRPAAGVEIWASTDSDKTSVVKLLARGLWSFAGRDRFRGFDIERGWFAPQGQRARRQTRVYLEGADRFGGSWNWQARVGTNGKTLLGSASIRSSDWSREFFVEREIVETPRGVDDGIYYTFAGASTNLVATARNTVTAMAGLQEFTGSNVRLHLRSNAVHVIDPHLGLSVQLRSRYFHSTRPGEFDYYSPRDFVQLVPVVQMRRFSGGWMLLAAAGFGAQKASGSAWQSAKLADLRVESPASSQRLHAFGQVEYSNSSLIGAAGDYGYVVGRLGLTARF